MKSTEQTINDFIAWHKGNHNEFGNPHPQYIAPAIINRTKYDSTSQNKYVRIARITIDTTKTGAQYEAIAFRISNVSSPDKGATIFDVFLRIRTNKSASSATVYSLLVNDNRGTALANIIQDDATNCIVDLYVKNSFNNATLGFQRIYEDKIASGNSSITYFTTDNYISSVIGNIIYPDYTVISTPFITNNTSSQTNQYALIGTVTLSAQYQYAQAELLIMGGASGGVNSQVGTAFFRTKQQASLGSTPIIELILFNNSTFTTSDIIAVITQNDDIATVVQLFVNVKSNYDELYFKPLFELKTGVTGASQTISWSSKVDLVPTLPSGTQTTAHSPI